MDEQMVNKFACIYYTIQYYIKIEWVCLLASALQMELYYIVPNRHKKRYLIVVVRCSVMRRASSRTRREETHKKKHG